MGGSATGADGSQAGGNSAASSNPQTSSADTSPMGMLGSALGGSALGAFHRKKAAPPASAPTPAATDSSQPAMGAVLMEMTMQKSGFSQQPVPASAFAVPAGYKRVETPN